MANTSYATIAELKERVSIGAGDSSNDTLLQQVLNSAAFLVDKYTRGGRPGYEAFSESASEVRYFDDEGTGFVSIDDATDVTAVSRAGSAVDAAYWKKYPYQDGAANPPITGILIRFDQTVPILVPGTWYNYPFRDSGAGQIAITAKWGFCAAGNRPPVVKEVVLTQAAMMVLHVGRPEANDMWHELHGMVAGMLTSLVRRVYVL